MEAEEMKPTKPQMAILEKCFTAEVNEALGKGCGFFQSSAQVAKDLERDGLLFLHQELDGAFRAEGYKLTHKGRAIYCANCKE
jgi:hypothetical protein